MISVSNNFKTAAKNVQKTWKGYITNGTTRLNEGDSLMSLRIQSSGLICKSIMRQLNATYYGNADYLGQYIHAGIGIIKADTTTEYIDYGSFKVITVVPDIGNTTIAITGYDRMYEANQLWGLDPIYDITYPTTLLNLIRAICTKLGWTLATTTFPNSSLAVATDLFTGLGLSYRFILDQCAEASGSIIYFDVNDQLTFRQISNTILDTVTPDELNSLKVSATYGPITSLVLSREPQEDNIAVSA